MVLKLLTRIDIIPDFRIQHLNIVIVLKKAA